MLYHVQILYVQLCKNVAFKSTLYCFNCYALTNWIYKGYEWQAFEMLMSGLKMPTTVMQPALQIRPHNQFTIEAA